MFNLRYGKRPIVEESQKISAVICVRNYIFDMQQNSLCKKFNLSNETDVMEIIKGIEFGTTFNLSKENNGETIYSESNVVKMTYTKSNIGKGYIFWFICNLCGRRVRYLYFPPNSSILACRKCHRLAYEKQNDSKKFNDIIKLLQLKHNL